MAYTVLGRENARIADSNPLGAEILIRVVLYILIYLGTLNDFLSTILVTKCRMKDGMIMTEVARMMETIMYYFKVLSHLARTAERNLRITYLRRRSEPRTPERKRVLIITS
jgi:hypothetical protein